MLPMRTSTIFRNRWWAVLWAAGILWFAYDVANEAPGSGDTINATTADAAGAPAAASDDQQLAAALNNL